MTTRTSRKPPRDPPCWTSFQPSQHRGGVARLAPPCTKQPIYFSRSVFLNRQRVQALIFLIFVLVSGCHSFTSHYDASRRVGSRVGAVGLSSSYDVRNQPPRRRSIGASPSRLSSYRGSTTTGTTAAQSLGQKEPPTTATVNRRSFLQVKTASLLLSMTGVSLVAGPSVARAEESSTTVDATTPLAALASNDEVSKLFNEGRALESQGNLQAAQRIYTKVTTLRPNFIYGWSNLGNTQTAFGQLSEADDSYTRAIELCQESIADTSTDSSRPLLGVKRCDDLYVMLLNRGCLRLNHNQPKEALADLQLSNTIRGRPDHLILQNLARAQEVNGMYSAANDNYSLAITMTSNEVNPFWLRAALVKYQLGDVQGGFDLFQRVNNRFPEAPEVRAAYAVFLYQLKSDPVAAQQKLLEIPDRARLKYSDKDYLTKTVVWPPAMIATLSKITTAVGDNQRAL